MTRRDFLFFREAPKKCLVAAVEIGGSLMRESGLTAEAQAAAGAKVVESSAVGVGYKLERACRGYNGSWKFIGKQRILQLFRKNTYRPGDTSFRNFTEFHTKKSCKYQICIVEETTNIKFALFFL